MNTDEMVRDLAADPKAKDEHFYRNSLLLWSAGTTALLALFFCILPIRADLAVRFESPFFRVETLLLLALFSGTTWVAYRSAIPGLLGRTEQRIATGLAVIFLIVLVSRLSLATLGSEFLEEMDFYRGLCGPILLSLAGLQTGVGMLLARRAAPTNLLRTGAWLGASAGAMALLATQLICGHENFIHLVVWHALPTALVVGGAAMAGRKWLRW